MFQVTASLVFEKSEGNVGELLQVQLVISSCAQQNSEPVQLSEVKVVFEGCLRPVKIQSDQNPDTDTTTPCCITSLQLREPSTSGDPAIQSPTSLATLIGTTDLTIGPSQAKVFNLTCIPREAGEARVASITMLVEEEKFDLAYAITDQGQCGSFWWQETTKGVSRRRVGKDRDTGRCRVMPKPPKIRITTPNLKEHYYTNERMALKIGIHNDEEEAADVTTEIRLFGSPDSAVKLLWLDADSSREHDESGTSTPTEGPAHFLKRSIGVMDPSSDKDLTIVMVDTQDAAKYELAISTVYNLVSDIQTPIMKTITVNLSFNRPFEANYEFLPQIHPQAWPNFFAVNDDLVGHNSKSTPGGLSQKWCLNSKVISFALEPLVIDKVSLTLLSVSGGAVCDIEPEMQLSPKTSHMAPGGLRESNFLLDIQKLSLGDRQPTALNLALEIAWHRREFESVTSPDSDSAVTTTMLEIPRFVIPMGEPRVLASATASNNMPGLIHLEYTLENPSTHFLTFNLAMEASEQFAFGGPKTTVVQLVPLSRHTVRYNLLAANRGLWIQPQLVVVDTYFNKTLRVLPTGDMRSDKKGILVWVDADD